MNVQQTISQTAWRKQKRGEKIFTGVVVNSQNKQEPNHQREHISVALLSKELGISVMPSPTANINLNNY